jgi:TonB family protein
MWQDILALGERTLWLFWVPVLVWTLIVLLYIAGERLIRMHPTMRYYLRSAVLMALPAGFLLTLALPTGLFILPGYLAEIVVSPGAAFTAGMPTGSPSDDNLAEISPKILFFASLAALFVSAIFLAGFGVLRLGRNHIRLLQHRRRLTPASDGVCNQADRLRHQLGIRRQVLIMTTSAGQIPYTFGLWRPVVVVPSDEQDAQRLEAILMHELVHVRRFDFLIQYAEQCVLAVGLFHPLVRLLVRDAQRFREMSCDAEVLSGTPVNLHLYASLLFEYACNRRNPALSVMISMASPTSRIKERIMNMQTLDKTPRMNSRVRLMSMSVAAVLLMSIAGLVACSDISNSQMQFEVEELQTLSEAERAAAVAAAQQEGADAEVAEVFIVVEQMPEPVGGMEAVYAGLVYPEIARRAGIEGRVVVQFIVDENGDVTHPQIIRAIGGGADEAVLEALQPVKFRPGMQRGRAVKVQMQLPIVFRLGE